MFQAKARSQYFSTEKTKPDSKQLEMKIRSTENNFQAFFFVAVIACFAMVSSYNCFAHHQTGEVSAVENRSLADLPSRSMAKTDFQKFVSLLEQFYNDRFASRLDLQKNTQPNFIQTFMHFVFTASGAWPKRLDVLLH